MCEIGYAVRQHGMVVEGERGVSYEANRESYGKNNVWRETDGQKNTDESMNMLTLGETVENLAKTSRVRWYGRVLRRNEDGVLRKALSFKTEGQRKRERPRKTWRGQVEEEIRGIGLRKEDTLNRAR